MAQTRITAVDQVQFPRIAIADQSVTLTNRINAAIYTSITAARIVTLPSAANYPKDMPLIVGDESGNCGVGNTITIAAGASDTILGNTTAKLARPYQRIILFSDGVSKWTATGLLDEIIQNIVSYGPLANALAALLVNTALTGIPTVPTAPLGTNTGQAASTAYVQNALSGLGTKIPLGQCILRSSNSTTFLLLPCRGNLLFIDGAYYQVPANGVTLSITGSAASLLYYIYAYMSGTTMMLEYVQTVPNNHPSYPGHKIKNGDQTRTLVGMFTTTTAGQITFGASAFLWRTWFNDPGINAAISSGLRWNGSGSSTPGTSNSAPSLITFLAWANENGIYAANVAGVGSSTTAYNYYVYVNLDGNNLAAGVVTAESSTYKNTGITGSLYGLAEGYHYMQLTAMNASNNGAVLYIDATTHSVITFRVG